MLPARRFIKEEMRARSGMVAHAEPGVVVCVLLLVVLSGCGFRSDIRGFSAYPGFDEYFAAHLVQDRLPTDAEKKLLERYRPRVILPPGHPAPVDFYRDYVPNTRLIDLATGRMLADPPGRGDLMRLRNSYTAALDLVREIGVAHPTVYGRIRYEDTHFPGMAGTGGIPLTFITYNIPFARSGLPARVGWLEHAGLTLMHWFAGWDSRDWHELDIYVAYTLVLDSRMQPFAVVLAQHNHHRSYLIGKDIKWPSDDRLVLDVAVSSNEIYLSSDAAEPQAHRTIPFANRLDYLLSGHNKPFVNGMDITYGPHAGGREIRYALKFLPPTDPFYTFKGRLGEYRPFLGYYIGRSGSPGADYYTLPALLPLGNTLKFGYLHDGDKQDIAAVRRYITSDSMDITALMAYGEQRLWQDWQALHASPATTATAQVIRN